MSPGYILKRILLIGYTLLVVSLIVFAITQVLPGDAAVMMLEHFDKRHPDLGLLK